MKKIITSFLSLALATTFLIAAWDYTGPEDERMPPGLNDYDYSLGWLAQVPDVSGLADVIEDGDASVEFPFGYFTFRIVNAIYGCTNGQEIIIGKDDPVIKDDFATYYDPFLEYYPTNNSRIVFAAITTYPKNYPRFTIKDWESLPVPDIIWTPTNKPGWMFGFTRSWWYEDYQDGLPYAHYTNLVRAARIERNWTNYYHLIRDAVPSPSERVWHDSFTDLFHLGLRTSRTYYDYMVNDPLFPADSREMQESLESSIKDD